MAKVEDKYFWQIGSPVPNIDHHTLIKHKILREYISAYIRTTMAMAIIPKLQLTLIDGFSGGGLYQTDTGSLVDGSPLIMLKTVNEERALLNIDRHTVKRTLSVNYEFIDSKTETIQFLKNHVHEQYVGGCISAEDYQKISYHKSDFLKEIPSLKQKILSRKMGERAIFLLDQYGYKDVPLDSIREILSSFAKSEVILNFNIGSMLTYMSDHKNIRNSLERIKLDEYIPFHLLGKIKSDKNYRELLQRYVAAGIKKETGAKFMTLFFVKPAGLNSWGYWLIHLCNNYKAHEVMKTLHWNNATYFGHELESGVFNFGYETDRDVEITGNSATFDFDENSRQNCIDTLQEDFGKLIYSLARPIAAGELFQNVVSSTPAAEVHLQQAIRQLHEDQSIIILNKNGGHRRPSQSYHHTDVIKPPNQMLLLPPVFRRDG